MKNINRFWTVLLSGIVSFAIMLCAMPNVALADEGEAEVSDVSATSADQEVETEDIEEDVVYDDALEVSEVSADETAGVEGEEYVADEAQDAIIGKIAYCSPFKGIEKIKKISDIPKANLLDVGDSAPYEYDENTGTIWPHPTEASTPRGQDDNGWTIYSISDMTTPLDFFSTGGMHSTGFDVTGQTGDLVCVIEWIDATYGIVYADINGEG